MALICDICKGGITPTVPGIKCVSCTVYFHIKCVNITKAQLDTLKSLGGTFWKGSKCLSGNNSPIAHQCNCCNILPGLLESIQKINETVEAMKQQLTSPNVASNSNSALNFENVVQQVFGPQKRKNNIILYGVPEPDP
ncbi:hypothetical protein Zmor_018184 [Zophobas morio]|uniref:Zinc finger PHD-type domain-containing protein n=1 Tax=Zophobas morio TaxID=2755281 RepID=A0AA38I6J0_9CUCU|nr:hypothetical protein Zmor_018184 [Zophobas morio]